MGIPEGITELEEECSTKRAEGSTAVVGEGVCKSKGWNAGRCNAQGAGSSAIVQRGS